MNNSPIKLWKQAKNKLKAQSKFETLHYATRRSLKPCVKSMGIRLMTVCYPGIISSMITGITRSMNLKISGTLAKNSMMLTVFSTFIVKFLKLMVSIIDFFITLLFPYSSWLTSVKLCFWTELGWYNCNFLLFSSFEIGQYWHKGRR